MMYNGSASRPHKLIFFFFNDTATTEIYTLSLHDALPISIFPSSLPILVSPLSCWRLARSRFRPPSILGVVYSALDRKSTRLNSSHGYISYAVFCLKKKKTDYSASVYYIESITQRDPDYDT